ncbi:hypothetical protein A4G20_09765 [Pasteurellaceae bacterium RH1A]|nr:hypothetical protein A4G20_09765 [Pasteurellaceae bacterium RH1A]
MKKLLLILAPALLLTACATPTQTSSVPMDMKAVEDYNRRVATGNTVTERPAYKQENWELNQSDRQPKQQARPVYHPRIYPSIGVHRGWGRTGLGVGLGGYY